MRAGPVTPLTMTAAPLRLQLDGAALADNWRALARLSGAAACGAAVKADGYGLGAQAVASRLAAAGCRDFFVATWTEAEALAPLGLSVSVLHGLRADDRGAAQTGIGRPVLNSMAQVARWRAMGGGTCDVMIDTGMNRLGLGVEEALSGALDGLSIDTLMSHLACADEDAPMNAVQRAAFLGMKGHIPARRFSLANSAGIALGHDYAFDLTRPGLALYGGVPRRELADVIRPVVMPAAQVLQRRRVSAGATIGYNATYTAPRDMDVAIINIGYADGYFRGFSGNGTVHYDGAALPVLGRVSMDLVAIGVDLAPDLNEGDWVTIDFALPAAAVSSGMSQYELLTGMQGRYDRCWSD